MQVTSTVQDESKDTFDRIDRNGDRILEIEEFALLMLEMNHRCAPTEMRAHFDAIDSDRDGRITREEFRAWLSRGSMVS